MPRSAAAVIRIAAVIAAVVAVQRLCVIPFRCNRAIHDARLLADRATTASSPSVAIADAQRSSALVQPYAETCGRTEVNVHIILAANAVTAGRNDEALAHYEEAIRVEPRPEIYFDRGMTKIAQHRTADGERDLVEAVRFNPYFLDQIGGETHERVSRAALRR